MGLVALKATIEKTIKVQAGSLKQLIWTTMEVDLACDEVHLGKILNMAPAEDLPVFQKMVLSEKGAEDSAQSGENPQGHLPRRQEKKVEKSKRKEQPKMKVIKAESTKNCPEGYPIEVSSWNGSGGDGEQKKISGEGGYGKLH